MPLDRSKPFRILFAHPKLSFGGGERVLIEQIAAIADLPIDVSIVFRKDAAHRDIEPEIRERNPRVGAVVHAKGILRCAAWLLRHRVDGIVLCGHHEFRSALRLLRLFGIKIPVMVTLHEHYVRSLRGYRNFAPLVQSWLCCYDFRAQVRESLGGNCFHIVHPLYPGGKPAEWNTELRAEARRGLGLPKDALVIGYVGRQDTNKAPWNVVRFGEMLQERLDRPVWVLFAGQETPDVSRQLDKVVQASPLAERVLRLGRMQDIAPAFTALDLFVLPSRSEGFFPLSLIEAMERGVPVATTTVGGITSVLKEGEGAFFIQKEDDLSPAKEAALEDCADRVAPLLHTLDAWDLQRQLAAQLIDRVRNSYDAAGKYREAILDLLGVSAAPDEPEIGA